MRIEFHPPGLDVYNTNVLWISRHNMLKRQIEELRRVLGSFKLVKVGTKRMSIERIIRLVRNYNIDYIIPILPFSMVFQLVKAAHRYGYVVLHCVVEVVEDGVFNPDSMYKMKVYDKFGRPTYVTKVFRKFEIIEDIKLCFKPFNKVMINAD